MKIYRVKYYPDRHHVIAVNEKTTLGFQARSLKGAVLTLRAFNLRLLDSWSAYGDCREALAVHRRVKARRSRK